MINEAKGYEKSFSRLYDVEKIGKQSLEKEK